MKRTARFLPIPVVALALVLAAGTPAKAEARSSFSFGISFGGPAPVQVVERQWVPGHYETRVETVLVAPERIEKVYVPAVVEQRCDRWGRHYEVVVQHGYYRDVVIPARYENRETRFWVEGYWQEVPVCAGPAVPPPPVWGGPHHPPVVHRPPVAHRPFINIRF